MWICRPNLEALEEAFSLEEMELSQHSFSPEEEDEEEVASFKSEDASASSSFRR